MVTIGSKASGNSGLTNHIHEDPSHPPTPSLAVACLAPVRGSRGISDNEGVFIGANDERAPLVRLASALTVCGGSPSTPTTPSPAPAATVPTPGPVHLAVFSDPAVRVFDL